VLAVFLLIGVLGTSWLASTLPERPPASMSFRKAAEPRPVPAQRPVSPESPCREEEIPPPPSSEEPQPLPRLIPRSAATATPGKKKWGVAPVEVIDREWEDERADLVESAAEPPQEGKTRGEQPPTPAVAAIRFHSGRIYRGTLVEVKADTVRLRLWTQPQAVPTSYDAHEIRLIHLANGRSYAWCVIARRWERR
jgi:hypothetical protein